MAEEYLGSLMSPSKGFAGKVTTEQLQALAGPYRDPKTTETLRVFVQGEKLYVSFEGSPLELHALSPTEFEPADYPFELQLKFEGAPGGVGSRKLVVKREMEYPAAFESISDAKPAAEELEAYAGDYWSDELRVTYRLQLKDGKLLMKDLIGADGISHGGSVAFNMLLPVLKDEFDLDGDTLIFHFVRDEHKRITGFTLDGSRERGISFTRTATH